ncbi:MAG: ribonuclease Z [Candidatus Aenigmatarchaeota archaeon]
MIRVVVLGSGGAVPSPIRNLPSIAIRYMGNVYLFDCAEGTQRQMMKYKISYGKVKGIFISHLHPDHILGIPGLVYTLKMIGRKEELLIFGPKGTKKRIENLIGNEVDFVKINEFEDENFEYKVEDARFYNFRTNHTNNSFGYVFEENAKRRFNKEKCKELGIKGTMFRFLEENGFIEKDGKEIKIDEVTYIKPGRKISYTGDTYYCEEIVEKVKNSDLLFHEATFMEKDREEAERDKHSTVLDAARIAKMANVKKLILFHISNRYKNMNEILEEGKKEFENIYVGKDGMEFLL